SDGDTAGKEFTVTVDDDRNTSDQTITLDEDSSYVIHTSADATLESIRIYLEDGVTEVTALGGVYQLPNGTITIDPETGHLTYTPTPNYSNYGGADVFHYSVAGKEGVPSFSKVTVHVTPVADAPNLGDAPAAEGNEDTWIRLNLKSPQITDGADQNGADVGDHPERLGLITLSGFPEGAKLRVPVDNGSILYTLTDGALKIYLSEPDLHLAGLDLDGVAVMSREQFESLEVLPPADSHENIDLTLKVTSYEVDASGKKLPDVDGQEASLKFTVEVLAVTDPIALSLKPGAANEIFIDEDNSFNLKDYLQVTFPDHDVDNNTPDFDGSEKRWVV